jgi:predicted secreted protein
VANIEVRDNGSSVAVSPGDLITIRLPENASTGYQWCLDELTGPVEVASDQAVPPERIRPGAAGERLIVLAVRALGSGHIRLALKRPWEAEPIERFVVNVTGK